MERLEQEDLTWEERRKPKAAPVRPYYLDSTKPQTTAQLGGFVSGGSLTVVEEPPPAPAAPVVPRPPPEHPIYLPETKCPSELVPKWAIRPPAGKKTFMEVYKDGTLLEILPLDAKPVYVIGRLDDVVDILFEHPSISRRHALIVHGGDHSPAGSTAIIDLGSAQGTYVFPGESRIAPNSPIPLMDGTKLRFANSTRTYIFRVSGDKKRQSLGDDAEAPVHERKRRKRLDV